MKLTSKSTSINTIYIALSTCAKKEKKKSVKQVSYVDTMKITSRPLKMKTHFATSIVTGGRKTLRNWLN